MKLQIDWEGSPTIRGLKVKGQWWIANGHVLAHRDRWDDSPTLRALCYLPGEEPGWIWKGGPDMLKGEQAMRKMLEIDVSAIPAELLRACLSTSSISLGSDRIAALLRVGSVLKPFDLKYALPFGDCEWRTSIDPRSKIYAFNKKSLVGMIMPLWLGEEIAEQTAMLLEVESELRSEKP